ncbi:MAG: diaminopimelate decarboxylase [Coriobacteriales bacterium]|jgi:diaminopimelate decarboxylase|nr:diaminopimelate decarboxylase [Coriobacteriales bacterium]
MAHLAHDPNKEPDERTTLELGAVLPQTAAVNKSGNLCVGGVDLVELARKNGTAAYVMDEDHVRSQLRSYRTAFAQSDIEAEVVFAGKAFLARAMAKLVNGEKCWLDVSSGGELHVALAAAFPAENIITHGSNKTPSELVEALAAGVGRIAVDSFEELERVNNLAAERNVVQNIFLRIKPGIVADTHEFIVTGAEDSKFGFGITDGAAKKAVLRAMELANVELKGLHVHIGSQIFSLTSFESTIDVMMKFMAELYDEHGIELEEFDLGGGLGIAYAPEDEPASIEDFVACIAAALKEHCKIRGLSLPRLFVEPGRSVVANAGVTLYTVGNIKDLPEIRTYVAIDGGMTDNIRTALYDAHYEAVVANKANEPRDCVVTLAGKHCESGDVVAIDTSLQTPEVGDIVCVLGTGAYCYTMASNYNKQVRPAVYFVRDGSERLVVRRETYDDLLNCDIF